MSCRPATPADADAVASLERAAMGVEAWSATQVGEELAAPGRVVLVAERRSGRASDATSGLAGWVDLVVAGDSADLLRVAVHPDARRTGSARRLLDAGVAALPHAAAQVVLEVAAGNAAARGLYASYGFVELGRRRGYYRDGDDALVMVRSVDRDRGGEA